MRSILLVSKVPFGQIGHVAMDAGSRSSVNLARMVLERKYGAKPGWHTQPADIDAMLARADACLIIGDPALRADPEALRQAGLYVTDLGAEWQELTGLPMVFAVWAGKREVHSTAWERAFVESYSFGREHLDAIVAAEHARRGVAPELVRRYLTGYIVFELGEREYAGMERYLSWLGELS